jgi:thiol-disulfide isomerase/thioredoxin
MSSCENNDRTYCNCNDNNLFHTPLPGLAPKTPAKDPKAPKPARKVDCVFEATSANFQQLVLESKVPVLVDIYADWCGPCKQLGPMLESAAMKSGKAWLNLALLGLLEGEKKGEIAEYEEGGRKEEGRGDGHVSV